MNKGWDLPIAFIAVHFSLILYAFPEQIFETVGSGYWAPVFAGFILEFLLLRFYLAGLSAFPEWDLIDIFKCCGIWMARIALLPLAAYFFMGIVMLTRSHAEMLTIVLLPKTPIWALMLIMLGIPVQASLQGLQTIMRAAVTLTLLSLPLILFSLISCFQNTEANYAFPLQFDLSLWNTKGVLASLFAYYGFLFIGPTASRWNFSLKRNRRNLYIGMLGLLPFYLLSVYIPLLIFGPEAASKFRFPLTVSIDTVNFEWLLFNRITIFYIAATLTLILIFLSILIWMTAKIVSALYVPLSRKTLSWIVAAGAFFAGLSIPNWETVEWLAWQDTPLRLYSMIFIPLMTWGIGIYKRRRVRK